MKKLHHINRLGEVLLFDNFVFERLYSSFATKIGWYSMAKEKASSTTAVVDETLKKSPLGQWLDQNKKMVFGGGIVLVLLSVGASFYFYQKEIKEQQVASKIYQEVEAKLAPLYELDLEKEKTRLADLLKGISSLDAALFSHPNMQAEVLRLSSFLGNNNFYQEAITPLELSLKEQSRDSVLYFVTALHLSKFYEELGRKDDAIKLLETLISHPTEVIQGRVYFDLARLYKDKGEVQKALANLNHIEKNFENSEYAKYARILKLELQK